MKIVDTVIIGAGSAGLSALRQVQQTTDSYVLIDPGPLGTTCARVGCMPSKVLIEVARDYHRRRILAGAGIKGAESLSPDVPSVLEHVRKLRDRFTSGMVESTRKRAGDKLVEGKAEFIDADTLRVNGEELKAQHIVIATGSSPVVPDKWKRFSDRILTTDNFFEQEDLPETVGVIGLGPVGLELGQAIGRLGIEAPCFSLLKTLGGLTDPDVNKSAVEIFGKEMPLTLGSAAEIEEKNGDLVISAAGADRRVDKLLLAMGVAPNLEGLGLEKLGIELDKRGVPDFNPATSQVADLPVYIAGDSNGCRPILHEALDEGYIAGNNASPKEPSAYCRRTPLRMVFSDPQIAVVGRPYSNLEDANADVAIGEADFAEQSRAVVEGANHGLLRVYVERNTARLLGAEMAVPAAEHLGHILSLAIQNRMTVFEMLQMPFYHPTLEEGLRSALRDAARQLPAEERPSEMLLCESSAEPPLC